MTNSPTTDRALLLGGAIAVVLAVLWWLVSFVVTAGQPVGTALSCLYDPLDACRTLVSEQSPYAAYPAAFLWAAGFALLIGLVGFGRALAAINSLASLWVFFLIGLISADVIGRAAFNHPIPGVPELIKFSIIGMFWLMITYTLRTGGHLRSNLILSMMSNGGRTFILVLNSVVGMVLFALITWLAWRELVKVWDIAAFEGEEPVRIPIWPVWGILTGGSALTALQFLSDAIRISLHGPSDLDDAGGSGTE